MSTYGLIYIARNETDAPNVYKVGKTNRSIEERMDELSGATSNLGKYEAVGYVIVTDIDSAEREIHQRLHYGRVQKNREFFESELSHIVTVIRDVCKLLLLQDHLPQIDPAGPSDPDAIIAAAKAKIQSSKLNELQLHAKLYGEINDVCTELSGVLDKIAHSFSGPRCSISITAPTTFAGKREDSIFEAVLTGKVLPGNPLDLNRADKWRSIVRDRPDDGRWLAIRAGFLLDWSRGPGVTHQNYLTDWRLFIGMEKIVCRLDFYHFQYHNFRCYTAATRLTTEFQRCLVSVIATNESRSVEIDRKIGERILFDISERRNKRKPKGVQDFDELDIDENMPDASGLGGFIVYDYADQLAAMRKRKR
jgi:hypothetical protein